MKRDHLLLFATFLFVMVLAGCCFDRRENHYQIPPFAYSMIPYDMGTTLRMRDASGAIATFEFVSASLEDADAVSCGRCCEDNIPQLFRLTMRGGDPVMDVEFSLLQEGMDGQKVHDPTVFQVTFNSTSRFSWTRYLSDPGSDCRDEQGNGMSCLYNYEAGGVVYDTLFQFLWPDPTVAVFGQDDVAAMWYSTEAGLVRFLTVEGNVWELIP